MSSLNKIYTQIFTLPVEDCDRWGAVIVSFGQNGTKRGPKCPQFGGIPLRLLKPLTILRMKSVFPT